MFLEDCQVECLPNFVLLRKLIIFFVYFYLHSTSYFLECTLNYMKLSSILRTTLFELCLKCPCYLKYLVLSKVLWNVKLNYEKMLTNFSSKHENYAKSFQFQSNTFPSKNIWIQCETKVFFYKTISHSTSIVSDTFTLAKSQAFSQMCRFASEV